MKNYKIFSVILLLTLFSVSCKKDYLERTPGVAISEDDIFADPALAARFADNAYNYVITKYVRFNDHRGCTAQASDEAVSGNSEGSITSLNRGLYHDHSNGPSLNDIYGVWKLMYAGIAVQNKMLARIGEVPPPPLASVPIFDAKRVEGEMRFLRALSYFELTKRFGGVPIIDKVYAVTDDMNNIPRSTYAQVTEFILKDIDVALTKLGTDAEYGTSNYGRPTLGAALALKSRVLLYAASPLNNPGNDKTKWQAAATAAAEIMKGAVDGLARQTYSLQLSYGDLLNLPSSPEYIMMRIKGPTPLAGEMMQDFSMSPGSGGAQGQMDPTQNHVDMYEMANGKAITDPTSGYDPQKPYQGREPRFYNNIVYNDLAWQGRKIEMWSTLSADGKSTLYGKDYSPTITYTATRYYCKKYWPEVYRTVGGSTTLLNYLYFRYGEILLNFAEAQNEAVGPGTDDGLVYAQLIALRKRAGIAQGANSLYGLKSGMNQDEMRIAIRHERAIELAFEDHRWYDIMRWKIGAQTIAVPMKGMDVFKNVNGTFTYTPIVLGPTFQKSWTETQNLYPIPRAEIYKSKGVLTQNPGWE